MRWLFRNWPSLTAGLVPLALAAYLLGPAMSRTGPAALAFALVPAFFLYQVEAYAWPGGLRIFLNQNLFGVVKGDRPLDERSVFWFNLLLAWVLFPVSALLFDRAPALAAGSFATALITGLVHGAAALRFRAWHPGLVTALTLLLPVAFVGYAMLAARLTGFEVVAAWTLAAGIHLCAIGYALLVSLRTLMPATPKKKAPDKPGPRIR